MRREWDLFHLTEDIQDEMSASKRVTSVVGGEKSTLHGNRSRVLFSSGSYSLCQKLRLFSQCLPSVQAGTQREPVF